MEYDFAFFETDSEDELSMGALDFITRMADMGWQLKQIVVTRLASRMGDVSGKLTVIMERNRVAVVPADKGNWTVGEVNRKNP